jgi:hypothetical protein
VKVKVDTMCRGQRGGYLNTTGISQTVSQKACFERRALSTNSQTGFFYLNGGGDGTANCDCASPNAMLVNFGGQNGSKCRRLAQAYLLTAVGLLEIVKARARLRAQIPPKIGLGRPRRACSCWKGPRKKLFTVFSAHEARLMSCDWSLRGKIGPSNSAPSFTADSA